MLANMQIQGKILVIITILGVAVAATGSVGYSGLTSLAQNAVLINQRGEDVKIGARMVQNLLAMNRSEYRMAMDPSEAGDASGVLLDNAKQFDERATQMALDLPPERQSELADVRSAYQTYLASAKTTIDRAQNHKDMTVDAARAEIVSQVHESRTQINSMTAKAKALVDSLDADSDAVMNQSTAQAAQLTLLMAAIAVSGLVMGLAIGLLIARKGVVQPIKQIVDNLGALTKGKLDITIFGTTRRDEVGDVARAAMVFRDQSRETLRLRAEQEELKTQVERDKKATMARMADEFQGSVGQVVETLAGAIDQLNAAATSMADTANDTSTRSVIVAAASEEASANVQTIASATEELSGSVNEIAQQLIRSTTIAQQAVEEADIVNARMRALDESAQKIGEIVGMITDIAGQTNLLALNATIEAARAGEAGRGFAVVASEVKALASQTARATEEISSQILSIQTDTKSSVEGMGTISNTIGDINSAVTAIAAAVEEQGAATQEIARNVQQASQGTADVSQNITGVQQAANETGIAATQVQSSASLLAEQSAILKEQVDRFMHQVRAA